MNKKQLKSFIESYISKSPNRHIEMRQALQDLRHRSQGGRPDAFERWLCDCLREELKIDDARMLDVEAEIAEMLHTEESAPTDQQQPLRMAAFRAPSRPDTPLPFTDEELRQQAREVLAKVGRGK